MRSCGLLTPVCLFSVIACGDDQAASSETATTTATTTTSSSTSTDAAATSADTDSSPTGDTGPELPAIARGIRLTRVTATQGVQTEVARDGASLTAEEYAVPLISRRKTVLRADWSLHAAFTPRELLGRLTVWTPEGDTHVDEFVTLVDGPSNDGDLLRTFAWQLPAALVRPGMEYRIEAFEVDASLATGEVSEPPPILPLAGRGALHVEDQPMRIDVLLVPVQHVFDGQTCTPEVDEADVSALQTWLEQHNPVERATLTLGEPMEYTASIGTSEEGFVPVLTALGIRRAKDKPPENLYYYGLLDSCDGYPPGLLGQAYGIVDEPSRGLAFQRIATGRYGGSGMEARDTFVHELGHSQGRFHVRCSGGEAGTDKNYPYPNGRIGVWGYGIHDTQLRSPTGYRDYMSYCNTSFVSDYGWDQTYGFIKELSSWDSAAASSTSTSSSPLLVGTVYADGRSTWWTSAGEPPRPVPGAALELDAAGHTLRLPASVREIPDSSARIVAARLPKQWSEVTELTLLVDGQPRASAKRAAVHELHP